MRLPNTVELYATGASVFVVAVAILLFQAQIMDTATETQTQAGSVSTAAAALRVVGQEPQPTITTDTNQNTMTITDIKLGAGAQAQNGQTVSVHYVGRLDDGSEFDNSHKRGAPIEFTLGAGQVIAGWEEGILGMNVGGERTLVIPPEKAYGEQGIGPIPPNATLTFTVELVAVN